MALHWALTVTPQFAVRHWATMHLSVLWRLHVIVDGYLYSTQRARQAGCQGGTCLVNKVIGGI